MGSQTGINQRAIFDDFSTTIQLAVAWGPEGSPDSPAL
jgi:hypothetical protein